MEEQGIALKRSATLKMPRLVLADGRYVTRGQPRSGGLASVYLATDTETGETVAIKVFRCTGAADDVIEESFRREVQALSELKHANVIRIHDSGRDDGADVHYIVMDWVEQDLKTKFLDREPFQAVFGDWDTYYDSLGRPVLEALAFAHARGVAHRDVKPSNILVTPEGQVRLCDFGISKIRNFLAPGITLAHFASAPFSPPEPDDGSYSYSRDVYGFAALSLSLLSATPLKSAADLLRSIDALDADSNVKEVLRRCLNQDNPEDRPGMASVLLAELLKAAPPPQRSTPVVLVALTNNVRLTLEHDLAITGPSADSFITADLLQATGEQEPEHGDKPGWSMRIYGAQYGYIGRMDESRSRLVLVSARDYSVSELERKSRQAFDLRVRLSISGTSPEISNLALEAMRERLAEEHEIRKHQRVEEQERKLFGKWLDLLAAKSELEKQRRISLKYEKREEYQNFVRLTLLEGEDASGLADQQVIIETGRRDDFQGVVVKAQGSTLLLRPGEKNRISIASLPEKGRVETDSTRSDMALDRQRLAVEAVRHGRSINPELGQLIANPARVLVPPLPEVEFIQKDMDEDKQDAVRAALAAPDLLVVEGPPGTGKTTFITELVLQTLRMQPNARVLLTSQTHVALDNSLERIVARSGGAVEAIRIGQREDDRIAASTRWLLLDEQLPARRNEALASGVAFLEDRAAKTGVPLWEIRRSIALDTYLGLQLRLESVIKQTQVVVDVLEIQKQTPLPAEVIRQHRDELAGLAAEQVDLEQSLVKARKDLAAHMSHETLVGLMECSGEELRDWVAAFENDSPAAPQLKQLLHIHADWSAEFGRSTEFKAALVASAQVVAGTCLGVASVPGKNELTYDLCIIDEASIATPTEVLVPMARSHRTILVGDNKQLSPFQDRELQQKGMLERYGLTPVDQRLTLFQRLTDGLPTDLHKTLTTQHRMLPALGKLVSDCFYDGELRSVAREPALHLQGVWQKPVTWFSTSQLARHQSRPWGTSHYNDTEVEVILKLLGRLDRAIRGNAKKSNRISVALLTGYGEQRQRLDQSVQTRRHEWSSFSDIYVNVVDAFQGREADVVLFSVTRSGVDSLGFLKEMERINVALSRGKELLGIVGDLHYCQTVKGSINPLKRVIDHMQRNPADCHVQELTA
ncbi:AAA domain-containing protein [Acidovorax sp. Be4]|uniref:AAA domain-containing protein n=1 Tax=Acidovorax bellezanensis TaxID=2976702 RepID=A0ABT2PKD0_9BURK|nr:serine/threonine-protein kinase [Acidovorax sp. Be4]MCT9810928.1 AAA domain-containing protein [Acidovorax sp. Be4]